MTAADPAPRSGCRRITAIHVEFDAMVAASTGLDAEGIERFTTALDTVAREGRTRLQG